MQGGHLSFLLILDCVVFSSLFVLTINDLDQSS